MKIDVEKEVAALRAMTAGQLCEWYTELFGEKSRTRHKAYLIRKIAWCGRPASLCNRSEGE